MSDVKPQMELAIELATYILESEEQDYLSWCDENEFNSNDFENNQHIYATAILFLRSLEG